MARKKKTINWTYYLIELAVVFIGVTAGFLLNNWREEQSDIKLENKYLHNFYAEVSEDQESFDSLIYRTKAKSDTLLLVFRESVFMDLPLTEKQAIKLATEVLYIEWFSSANDTYEDILNSGNLNLINDYSIKEKISRYYSFLQEVIKVEQYYKDHMNSYIFPLLYEHYDLVHQKFESESSYQSLEFNNKFLAVISLLQQNLKVYQQGQLRNTQLKKALSESLNKH